MSLPNNALIARLRICMPGNRHKDNTLTHDVHHRHGMAADSGLYQKLLLPETAYCNLKRVATNARKDHGRKTFTTDYGAILPAAKVDDYLECLTARQAEWDVAVREFIAAYPKNLEIARRRLNGAFKPDDYPRVSELPRLFTFEFPLLPMPNAETLDHIVGLADDRVQQMRAQLQRSSQAAADATRQQLLTRILDRVQHLGNALANPEGIVRANVLDRFRTLLDDAGAMNLTADPGITRLVADCRQHLTLAAEPLRNDPALRRTTLAAASLLLQSHGRRIEAPKASA
jgi:hypothetical protein